MRNFLTLGVGLLLLAFLAPAARAGGPATTRMVVAPLAEGVAGVAQQPWEIIAPGSDVNGESVLPLRFAERSGAKLGAAVGLAAGGSVGFALFGTPGAAFFGAIGALCGEVLGEFAASNIFNPRRVPYLPPLNAPLIPGR